MGNVKTTKQEKTLTLGELIRVLSHLRSKIPDSARVLIEGFDEEGDTIQADASFVHIDESDVANGPLVFITFTNAMLFGNEDDGTIAAT